MRIVSWKNVKSKFDRQKKKSHLAKEKNKASKLAFEANSAFAEAERRDALVGNAQTMQDNALRNVEDAIEEGLAGRSAEKTTEALQHMHFCRDAIAQASELNKIREEAKADLENVMGVSPVHMAKKRRDLRKLQIARVLFLMVITGCEMDVDGFMLAFLTYWHAGESLHPNTNWTMKVLLVLLPCGYVLAIFTYVAVATFGAGKRLWACLRGGRGKGLAESLIVHDAQEQIAIKDIDTILSHDQLPEYAPKEAVTVQFYHCLPVVRCYLLIKDPDPGDIEALMRVNALSTFTLGVAQILCMFLGFGNGSLHWEVKTYVSAFAQVINITMTLLFFFTKYPDRMKKAMQIEAYQHNCTQRLDAEYQRYTMSANMCTLRFGNKIEDVRHKDPSEMQLDDMDETQRMLWNNVQHFRDKWIRDINLLSQNALRETLENYSSEDLFRWRRLMVEAQVATLCD